MIDLLLGFILLLLIESVIRLWVLFLKIRRHSVIFLKQLLDFLAPNIIIIAIQLLAFQDVRDNIFAAIELSTIKFIIFYFNHI